ncbi:MAG TPA: hypothetical protein VGX23_26035 [Actinocrinis sp.]|nr:hypothetical protein [Actinocrinis sp.]
MTQNKKQTSDEIASLAATILQDPKSTPPGNELAGSALDQSRPHDGGTNQDQTSNEIASLASKVLQDPKSTQTERELAGSVLAQSGSH